MSAEAAAADPMLTGSSQWRAEVFQLVNWGGFEGRVRFDFHPGATLISGHSGTGKSTLLDAYIALMMPSDTPFNGASNDAVGGRARSEEQRNLLSYLRGKTDAVSDDDGRVVDQLLRGRGTATWGAVGMTFVNDVGQRLTALRVYYVPARATRTDDLTMRMATYDGHLDLADLAQCVDQTFAPKALKTAFSGLRTYDSYAAFAQALHTRLGIGANGDGEKALRLLVRIQAGHQIRTVDQLYKEMVLERPATYAAADRALDHFDNLEAAYVAMQTEQHKVDLLSPITARHAAMVAAQATIEALDTVGLTRDGDTPLLLWRLRTEQRLLGAALGRNREARVAVADDRRAADASERDLVRDLASAQEEHRAAGGADLERLAVDITDAGTARDEKLARRSWLTGRIVALDETPGEDRAWFDRLTVRAEKFLNGYEEELLRLEDERKELGRAMYPLAERQSDLRKELASLEGRTGRVPRILDDMRREVAAAADLDVEDLPFVAELIDVADDQQRWRPAIETVLGASARMMLVPDDDLDRFSAAIDRLRLRGRLTFSGAPLAAHRDVHADPDLVAGKLVYKDSPFSGWVAAHVADPSRNARCVESAADLAGPGFRVTVAGQTRRGRRGSHGRSETANIIGFDNAETVADLQRQLDAVSAELAGIDGRERDLQRRGQHLNAVQVAAHAVQAVTWDDVDVAGAEDRLRRLEQRRDAILASDDRLRALAEQIAGLEAEVARARERVYRLKERREALDAEHGRLVDAEDEVTGEVDRIEAGQRVQLTEEQSARLDEEFAAAADPGDPGDLGQLPANLVRLRQRLEASVRAARTEVARAEDELAGIFSAYQLKWEDPNLGRTAASYDDYARILDNIVSTGLHQRRDEWRRRLTDWSGQDLVPLAGAMDSAIEDVIDRLVPINEILAGLEFGANADRLRIKLRRLSREEVSGFRRDLRKLSSLATADLDDVATERRFGELQAFMARMRRRDDPRAVPGVSDRDRLLDVRKHVEITAEAYTASGAVRSTYTTLGGKSGGESQELVAFIVGAALRFRLGDENRARPRFAPVFLDEGFVKADAQFAGRAVQAWKGLGFQLIVGAPVDKVTALEPHMDELLGITKNETTHYSFVNRLRDVDVADLSDAGVDG